jgi:hypothetical protein
MKQLGNLIDAQFYGVGWDFCGHRVPALVEGLFGPRWSMHQDKPMTADAPLLEPGQGRHAAAEGYWLE